MNPTELAQRAEALMHQTKWVDAIGLLDQAIDQDRGFGWAYYARGVCKLKDLQDEEALPDFTVACKLMPKFSDAFVQKGLVLSLLQNPSEAIRAFTSAIELEPTNASAYTQRGVCLLDPAVNKPRNAEEDFLTAIGLGDPDANKWLQTARAILDETSKPSS